MSYEFEIGFIRAWVSEPVLPTQKNEETLRRILRELTVRLARLDLGGNNGLWTERLADQVEDTLAEVKRKIMEHQRKQGFTPIDEADLVGDLK